MATVTKPIALDESLNTTELSSRNVADVLAQELSAVATAIGGIAVPSADHVSYDNSVSGLSATDVQNALDEIVSDIPTVNNGTLTIQQNGTSKGSFTANSASNVNVNIETPTADKKTATDQFTTADGGLLSKCQINLVPVQSGSGDPYPAGGGKNKFDGTSIIQANIQSNGTISNASVNNRIIYCKCSPNTTYTISKTAGTAFRVACYSSEPTNGSTSVGTVTTDNTASSITITTDASATYIGAWVWNSADSLTADQMLATCQIELGNQATPYAPPSNVRPISGHTQVEVENHQKNLCDDSLIVQGDIDNSTGTDTADGSLKHIRSGYCNAESSTQYTVSHNHTIGSGTLKVFEYRSDKSFIRRTNAGAVTSLSYTFTTHSECKYIRIAIYDESGISKDSTWIQLELGSTATPYEPYLGHLYQVQIGSTVYGGYVDLVSGVMRVTHTFDEFDGSETWDIGASNNYGQLYYLDDDEVLPRYANTITELCNWLPKSNNSSVGTPNGTITGYSAGGNAAYLYFFVRFDFCADVNAWKTFLSNKPLQVVYRVATPFTIQLTPQQIETLVGQNNLSTPLDGQSIETNGVEYKELFTFADVKSYVDKKIPDAPTTDGTYTLQAVVSGGVPTYSWT